MPTLRLQELRQSLETCRGVLCYTSNSRVDYVVATSTVNSMNNTKVFFTFESLKEGDGSEQHKQVLVGKQVKTDSTIDPPPQPAISLMNVPWLLDTRKYTMKTVSPLHDFSCSQRTIER